MIKYDTLHDTNEHQGVTRYDENGHPVALAGAKQRAEELFDVSYI